MSVKNLLKYTKDNVDTLVNNVSSSIDTKYTNLINETNNTIINVSSSLENDYNEKFNITEQTISEVSSVLSSDYVKKIGDALISVVKFRGILDSKVNLPIEKLAKDGDLWLVKTTNLEGEISYDEYLFTKDHYEIIGNVENGVLKGTLSTKEELHSAISDLSSTIDYSKFLKFIKTTSTEESINGLNPSEKLPGYLYRTNEGDLFFFDSDKKKQLVGPIKRNDLENIYLKKDEAHSTFIKSINDKKIEDKINGEVSLHMSDIYDHSDYALSADVTNINTALNTRIDNTNSTLVTVSGNLKDDYTNKESNLNTRIDNTRDSLSSTINSHFSNISSVIDNDQFLKFINEKIDFSNLNEKTAAELKIGYTYKTNQGDTYFYDGNGFQLIGPITSGDLHSKFAKKEFTNSTYLKEVNKLKVDNDNHGAITITMNDIPDHSDYALSADVTNINAALNTRIDNTNSKLTSEVNRLENDYTEKNTLTNQRITEEIIRVTKEYNDKITEKLVNVIKFKGVVNEGKLPVRPNENVEVGDLYLVKTEDENGLVTYDEYVYVQDNEGNTKYELIGNIKNVDLNSDFSTKEERINGDQELNNLIISTSGLIDNKIDSINEVIINNINSKNAALNDRIDNTNSTLNARITSEKDELSSTIDNNKFIKYIDKHLSFNELNNQATDLLPGHYYKTTEGDSYFFDGESFQLVGPITTTDLNNVYAKKTFTDDNYIKEVNTLKVTDENHGVINLHMTDILDNEKYAFNEYVNAQDTKLENNLNTKYNVLNNQTIKLSGEVNEISGNLVNDISKTNETIQTISTTIKNDYTKAISDSLVKVVKFKGTCESYEKLPKQYNNSPNAKGNNVELGDLYIVETEFIDENHNNKTRWDEYVFVNKGTDEIPVYDYELIGSIENVDLNGDFTTKEYVGAADKILNDSINEKYQELTNTDKTIGERITSEVNTLNETINTKHDSLNDKINSASAKSTEDLTNSINSLSSTVDNNQYFKLITPENETIHNLGELNSYTATSRVIGHTYITEDGNTYVCVKDKTTENLIYKLVGPISKQDLNSTYLKINDADNKFIKQVNGINLNTLDSNNGAITISMNDIPDHSDYALSADVTNINATLNDRIDNTNSTLITVSGNLKDDYTNKESNLNDRIDNTNSTLVTVSGNLKDDYTEKISNALISVVKFKGIKNQFGELPASSNAKIGDLWLVKNSRDNGTVDYDEYLFTEKDGINKYELIGNITNGNLSGSFATKEELNSNINDVNINISNNTELYNELNSTTEKNKNILNGKIDQANELIKSVSGIITRNYKETDTSLKSDIDTLNTSVGLIKTDLKNVPTNIDNKISIKANEINETINVISGKLSADFISADNTLRSEMAGIKTVLKNEYTGFNTSLNSKIDSINKKINDVSNRLTDDYIAKDGELEIKISNLKTELQNDYNEKDTIIKNKINNTIELIGSISGTLSGDYISKDNDLKNEINLSILQITNDYKEKDLAIKNEINPKITAISGSIDTKYDEIIGSINRLNEKITVIERNIAEIRNHLNI